MRLLKWIGPLLLLLSAYPLALQVAEIAVSDGVYERYLPTEAARSSTRLHGHRIDITNQMVVIDGQRIPRLGRAGSLSIVDVLDRRSGVSLPVVVEWRGGADKSTWEYRTLTIDGHGRVVIDHFHYSERGSPRLRTVLARFVSPSGIGFFSDTLQAWPTVFYPIIFPWLTAIAGLAIVLGTLFSARRHR